MVVLAAIVRMAIMVVVGLLYFVIFLVGVMVALVVLMGL